MIITGIDSAMIVKFIENSIPVKRAVCVDGKYAITIKAHTIVISKLGDEVRLTIYRAGEGLEPFIINILKGVDFDDLIIY